jgi:predicted small lipoprotein YifL
MIRRNHLRSALVLTAVAALVMVAACTKRGGSPFPDSNEVTGWQKTGETRTFSADKLYEYIDGDAEKYVKAGVKSTSTADYKYQDKIEAVADVYTMSDANGAKTIFESEPAGSTHSVSLGDAARASNQSVVFRKGAYLVRIVAYQETPDVQQALLGLSKGIESKLE